jgi:hypothetical protein
VAQRDDRRGAGIVAIGLVGAAGVEQPGRAESTGGTSTTDSPAATSCWANSAPHPDAASIAQRRGSKSVANANSSPH